MNTYEMLARERKAAKIADTMRANGWDKPYLVEAMTEFHWYAIAKAAGVNSPSQATRDMVLESLRRSQPVGQPSPSEDGPASA